MRPIERGVAAFLLVVAIATGARLVDIAGAHDPAQPGPHPATTGSAGTLGRTDGANPFTGPVGAVAPFPEEAPSTTTTTVPPRPANEAHWLALGRCEQPGGGYGGVDWQAAGWTSVGYFAGGLGILDSLYRSIAGHSALDDPPEAQMTVANVVLDRFGPGAWGCQAPL